MAFNIEKINPLDLQPRKAIGVSLPFSNKAVFNQTYQTKDAIKTNLINFFLTNKGERYLNPEFGSDIHKLLFEQIDELVIKQIKNTVKRELNIFFPRIEPKEILAQGFPEDNTVQFSMNYTIRDTNIEDEVVINFLQ